MHRVPAIALLTFLVAMTAAAWAVQRILRHRWKQALRGLAAEWRLRYVQADLFRLAERLAGAFPEPGAADLTVRDILYGSDGDRHRYVFTAEYTQGALTAHRRVRRVATFCDPREAAGGAATPLILAPAELPLLEQYRRLRQTDWGRAAPASNAPAGAAAGSAFPSPAAPLHSPE